MLLGGKFAKPIPNRRLVYAQHLTNRLNAKLALIQAAPGYLLTESLAASLEEQGQVLLWLRLGWEDFDPATCLLSLISTFQEHSEKIGTATLEAMRRLPGPIQGWPALFAQLGDEIREHMQESFILVLENLENLTRAPQTWMLLGNHFLPALPRQASVSLISQVNLPGHSLREQPEVITTNELRLPAEVSEHQFQNWESISEKECLRQAVHLVNGSMVGISGLCMAAQLLGEAYVKDVLKHRTTQAEVFAQIAQDWLDTLDKLEIQSTDTLTSLGYNHPDINQSLTGRSMISPAPWTQQLNAGWIRPHRIWLSGIERALRLHASSHKESIHCLANYLCRSGAHIAGVNLFLSSGSTDCAAQCVAQNVDAMLNLGQWELLSTWLERLPERVLASQPRLLQASGEIKSAQGDLTGAAHDYERAGEGYNRQGDQPGQISSLLALSALADKQGKAGEAWSNAQRALLLAQKAQLTPQERRAELQISLLALNAEDISSALTHLEIARQKTGDHIDPSLAKYMDALNTLLMEQKQHQEQRQQRYQSYLDAQQAEQNHLKVLQDTIQAPMHFDDGSNDQGWLQTPLALKLGAALQITGPPLDGKPSLLEKITAWLQRDKELNGHEKTELPQQINIVAPKPASQVAGDSIQFPSAPQPPAQPVKHLPNDRLNHKKLPAVNPRSEPEPSMAIYCLGPFGVYLNKQPVLEWPSSKGKSIFKYLVVNRERPVVKEILMELFWPEISPDAARNNLNVAIYGLRQALRQVQPSFSHILFQEDSYLLNPDLHMWMDYLAFTELINSAQALERQGNLDAAIQIYRDAEALYQGEFMEDERYETWPAIQRQHLQDNYLNMLDQLISYYYDHNDDLACTALCRKMLAIDSCREESHRTLMRCYLRQGHPHLALRQYHLCVNMLREELDIQPAPETMALYAQIRQS